MKVDDRILKGFKFRSTEHVDISLRRQNKWLRKIQRGNLKEDDLKGNKYTHIPSISNKMMLSSVDIVLLMMKMVLHCC